MRIIDNNDLNVRSVASEYNRYLCGILRVASVISYECYVTEECPIAQDGYRVMWLTFTEAGSEIFQQLCDGKESDDVIKRLMAIVLDAYLLERRMCEPTTLEQIWRTRPQSLVLDGRVVLKVDRQSISDGGFMLRE